MRRNAAGAAGAIIVPATNDERELKAIQKSSSASAVSRSAVAAYTTSAADIVVCFVPVKSRTNPW